jgi:hypothetical protein
MVMFLPLVKAEDDFVIVRYIIRDSIWFRVSEVSGIAELCTDKQETVYEPMLEVFDAYHHASFCKRSSSESQSP